MYNYNRDVYQLEFERAERLATAAERRRPLELRSDRTERARRWLSQAVLQPVAGTLASYTMRTRYRMGAFLRRKRARAAGMFFNALGEVSSIIPGRA